MTPPTTKVEEFARNTIMTDLMATAAQPELPALQYRLASEFKITVTASQLSQALRAMYKFQLLDSRAPLGEMGDYARRTLAAMCSV